MQLPTREEVGNVVMIATMLIVTIGFTRFRDAPYFWGILGIEEAMALTAGFVWILARANIRHAWHTWRDRKGRGMTVHEHHTPAK